MTSFAKVINNPLGEMKSLANQAAEGLTDMVSSSMPSNYYEQIGAANKLLATKNGYDKLEVMKDFRIEVVETKQCSNQEPCKYFQTVYDIKFRYSPDDGFRVRFEDPGCCNQSILGNFMAQRDILGKDDHKNERLYTLEHIRKCCCLRWFGLYDPLPYGCVWFYCLNICCKPTSIMKHATSGQLIGKMEYSPMGWDVRILGDSDQVLYTLKKRCWDGNWDLYDSKQQIIHGFLCKKNWSSGNSCNECSKFAMDIEFPPQITGKDKAAILFALTKAV